MQTTSFCGLSARGSSVIAALALLGGCGTYVPSIAEGSGEGLDMLLENAIVQSIHCELRNAVIDTIEADKKSKPPFAEFLETWAVQATLTLTIDERTTAGPTIGMSFPPGLFTLGMGANVTTAATRVDKLNYYYSIKDLQALKRCGDRFADDLAYPSGSLLIRNNLKTKDWLMAQVLNKSTGNFSIAPSEKNAFQHQVTFVVDTGGGITPGAKLATVSINPSGVTLTANRKRTHDLSLVFGPADKEQQKNRMLSDTAQAIFLSSQITSGIQAGVLRVGILP